MLPSVFIFSPCSCPSAVGNHAAPGVLLRLSQSSMAASSPAGWRSGGDLRCLRHSSRVSESLHSMRIHVRKRIVMNVRIPSMTPVHTGRLSTIEARSPTPTGTPTKMASKNAMVAATASGSSNMEAAFLVLYQRNIQNSVVCLFLLFPGAVHRLFSSSSSGASRHW